MKHYSLLLPLLVATLTSAFGCGGAAKSASEPGQSPSSSSDGSGEDSSSSAPLTTDTGESAKPAKPAKSAEAKDDVKIAEGLLLVDRRSLSLEYNLNLGEGKGIDSGSWSFSEERSMRVKSAKKDVISELQVVFGKWDAKPLLGLSYDSPTNGKTYMLTGTDGGLEVVRGAGDQVSSDEKSSIKFEYGWIGARSPLRQALVDADLKSGAELPKSAEITQILLGSLPGIDPSKTEVSAVIDKLDAQARKRVVLKTQAKTRIVSNKTTLDLEMSGTTTVDLSTGWVIAADMAGTIQGGGTRTLKKHGDVAVSGKGKVTYQRSSEFR